MESVFTPRLSGSYGKNLILLVSFFTYLSLTKWLKNYRQKDLKQYDLAIVIENFEFLSSLNYFDVLEYFS